MLSPYTILFSAKGISRTEKSSIRARMHPKSVNYGAQCITETDLIIKCRDMPADYATRHATFRRRISLLCTKRLDACGASCSYTGLVRGSSPVFIRRADALVPRPTPIDRTPTIPWGAREMFKLHKISTLSLVHCRTAQVSILFDQFLSGVIVLDYLEYFLLPVSLTIIREKKLSQWWIYESQQRVLSIFTCNHDYQSMLENITVIEETAFITL